MNQMIYFLASSTYCQVIQTSIRELDLITTGSEMSSDLYLLKYLKENLNRIQSADCIILDLTAFLDTDEEILSALEMLKIMADHVGIIILAANRQEGDELLTKAFQMSIYNLIATDDFNIIRNELHYCLSTGKQYKDSLSFKDVKKLEKVIIKQEIKQTVNKIMVGLCGSQERVGTTHHSILLANFLRKKGYMVALVEANESKAFQSIQKSFEEKMFGDYFSLNGVDYYPGASPTQIGNILGKSYNFILVDFGSYQSADSIVFNKCDVRIIVTGSRPWEVDHLNEIFLKSNIETLKGYHYCFNYTVEKERKDIVEGMLDMKHVYFTEFTKQSPFSFHEFPSAELILKDYMPIKLEPEKKKLFFNKKGSV